MQRLTLILLFIVISMVPIAPALAAQPTYASPYGFSHDIPYFAINLVPGGTVEVGMWLERLPSEPENTIRYVGEIGTIIVDLTNTDSGRSFHVVTDTIAADTLMKQCSGGVIQVNERILQMDINGDYTILLSKRSNLAPCGWAGTDVVAGSAVAPTTVVYCGPNNDFVTLAAQPAHVILLSDSGWISGERVLQYGADPGYALTGSGEFRLFDNPNLLCPSPIITPPVVINTPTPRIPPIVIRPTPPGFPLPIITIVPPTQLPYPNTPPPDAPTPTPRIIFPYPVQPTPRGFPVPFPTFGPAIPPPAKTDATTPERTADDSQIREVAVLSLAPVAVILGVIAASRRRDE